MNIKRAGYFRKTCNYNQMELGVVYIRHSDIGEEFPICFMRISGDLVVNLFNGMTFPTNERGRVVECPNAVLDLGALE